VKKCWKAEKICFYVFIIFALFIDISKSWAEQKTISVLQAIEFVAGPAPIMSSGNESPFELQTYYRLNRLNEGYSFQEADVPAWKALMKDEKANIYARLCAAYFLLDSDAARRFIEQQLRSDNLRHRYNAANVVYRYVERYSDTVWGIDLLIEQIANGSLDPSGVLISPRGDYPDHDRNDIMSSPLDMICYRLGGLRLQKTVPALISVLERQPNITGAAYALGEIKNPVAQPILIKILKEGLANDEEQVVRALGKLKSAEAVPLLIARLEKSKVGTYEAWEDQATLETLLEIRDSRAIIPIKKFISGEHPAQSRAIAKRVLVQLEADDPVASLIALFKAEAYEPEKSDIVGALTQYHDKRVVEEFSELARNSDSAFMRREAIIGLRQLDTRASLKELTALLGMRFPEHLKANFGWKEPPHDFSKYFPRMILECLRAATTQDFGTDVSQWNAWIIKNIKE